MLKNWYSTPSGLFTVLALIFGVLFTALIPPQGGGNEQFNVQRAFSIAYGGFLIQDVSVPSGMVDFIATGANFFKEGITAPFGFDSGTFDVFAAIPLNPSSPKNLTPNAIAVLNPQAYLTQSLSIRMAAELGASPLILMYIGRFSGLIMAILLTAAAIRIIPSHRYTLCALALLPPITFGRSTLDADQLNNALAFLLIALILREVLATGLITKRRITSLALCAFFAAQCKTAYVFLPLLALAIPATRFSGQTKRFFTMTLLFLPGMIASIAWAVHLKTNFFIGTIYRTWAGIVDSDAQIAFILTQPLDYLMVFLNTLYSQEFWGTTIYGLIGIVGPFVLASWVIALLFALFVVLALSDSLDVKAYSQTVKWLGIIIFVLSAGLTLTFLYLQWNPPQGATIRGFNGRYLYPVLPLLFPLVPKLLSRPFLNIMPRQYAITIAWIGLVGTLYTSYTQYYG